MPYKEMRKWYLLASIHFRQPTYCIRRSELLGGGGVYQLSMHVSMQTLVIRGLSFWHPSLIGLPESSILPILQITFQTCKTVKIPSFHGYQ